MKSLVALLLLCAVSHGQLFVGIAENDPFDNVRVPNWQLGDEPGSEHKLIYRNSFSSIPSNAIITDVDWNVTAATTTPATIAYPLLSAPSGSTTWNNAPAAGTTVLAQTQSGSGLLSDSNTSGMVNWIQDIVDGTTANHGLIIESNGASSFTGQISSVQIVVHYSIPQPSFTISAPERIWETEVTSVTVRLSEAQPTPTTFTLSKTDIDTTSADFYVSYPITFTIPAGQISGNQQFHIREDDGGEREEWFSYVVSSSQTSNSSASGLHKIAGAGDADLDGDFDSSDLVLAYQSNEYEDGIEDNSTWYEGDWNADGDFDSSDLVDAFEANWYEE